MTSDQIIELAASRLPVAYPLLKLTFYGSNSVERGDYVIIGNDYGTDLCVRKTDGAVYGIDPQGRLPTRFVNSSIEQYAEFIQFYDSHFGGPNDIDEGITGRAIRDELQRLDPIALSDTNDWWSCIYEEMAG